MSKNSIEKLPTYLAIPPLKKDSMAGKGPFKASINIQKDLGFPGEKIDNWQQVAINKIAETKSKYRSVQVFLDSCMKCGVCTDKCHYYLGTADPKNMPVARQDLFRSVYRRHFTFAGKYFPKLVGAKEFDEDMLDDWYNYFHQCSQCRRCAVFCPIGIDTAEISMAAREVMNAIGVGQKYPNQILGKINKIGNNLGMPEPALRDTLADLEEAMSKVTDLNSILRFGRKTKAVVTLPRFKLESELDLVAPLKQLGMTDMFEEFKADFSGMTGGTKNNLFVSQVKQKAFVEVNEEGAEAAAATFAVVSIGRSSGGGRDPLRFRCDRPFMFLIRDNLTGMILFSGHVNDPSK